MPHVKIEGALSMAELFGRLPVWESRDETGLRKISTYYLEREGRSILAEALVVDGGLPRHFFMALQGRENELVVRPLPATDPEKTPAVKRLVAQLGLRALALCEGARIKSTNLTVEIEELGGA